MSLDGKAVVVTGGASGIGRAMVRLFLERGARVAAVDRDAEALEALAAELPQVTTLAADVAYSGAAPSGSSARSATGSTSSATTPG